MYTIDVGVCVCDTGEVIYVVYGNAHVAVVLDGVVIVVMVSSGGVTDVDVDVAAALVVPLRSLLMLVVS